MHFFFFFFFFFDQPLRNSCRWVDRIFSTRFIINMHGVHKIHFGRTGH